MARVELGRRSTSTDTSSNDSRSSQATIKAPTYGDARETPPQRANRPNMFLEPFRKTRFEPDTSISPGTAEPGNPFNSLGQFAPDSRPNPPESSQSAQKVPRRNLNLDSGLSQFPFNNLARSQRSPNDIFTRRPSGSNNSGFYHEPEMPEFSPTYRPHTADTSVIDSPEYLSFQDDRRPSATSVSTTASSGTSKGSGHRGFHKKLQGFFGDEYLLHSPHSSELNLPENGNGRFPNAQLSRGDSGWSSTSTRAEVPPPDSNVVPFLYQESGDLDLPPRASTFPEKQEEHVNSNNGHHHHHRHRLHLPGHRHTKSKEDPKHEADRDLPLRPTTAREDSLINLSRPPNPKLIQRSTSPSPGSKNPFGEPPRSPSMPTGTKKSIFNVFKKGRHKEEVEPRTPPLPSHSPFTRSTNASAVRVGQAAKPTPPSTTKRLRDGSVSAQNEPPVPRFDEKAKRSNGRRGTSYDKEVYSQVQSRQGSNATTLDSLFDLDTDLSKMDGIVSTQAPQSPSSHWRNISNGPMEDPSKSWTGLPPVTRWNAPESWEVGELSAEKPPTELEIEEEFRPQDGKIDERRHSLRVFRIDSTFATLSLPLYATVSEVLQQLGKKSFLQDDLANYQIVLRKHDLQKILSPNDKPVAIQKRLLEQAGYFDSDRLEEIGRDDNSYLCRFTFIPARISGYSLEKDPGFARMQKYSNVDLQGRNLITIPITLYRRAQEILVLNLSKNLSLNVPSDFIQSCVNLREIKFTGNEATRVPPSLGQAMRLTVLDISNNRIEQLDTAELDKLSGLLSLKIANNRLRSLPRYISNFTALRSLNLSSNYLDEIPSSLSELKSLTDLDISFNNLSQLPIGIGNMILLEKIVATNNKISGPIPADFAKLVNLKELDIRFNSISNMDIVSQMPRLEYLAIGHNSVSVFEGSFIRLKLLHLNHNPVTRFILTAPVTSLTTVNLASAQLSCLDDNVCARMPNIDKLILNKNHITQITGQLGKLRHLQHLAIAKNGLNTLPPEIKELQELSFLDLRENNLKTLPPEIWHLVQLHTLNLSSNILTAFPKPSTLTAPLPNGSNLPTPILEDGPLMEESTDELRPLDDSRRPSQASGGFLSVANSPANSTRKASVVSVYGPGGRKASVFSRSASETTLHTMRKDSTISNRLTHSIASSLRNLYLADNRLTDDIFDEISLMPELRVLNLSYNEIYDIPNKAVSRWPLLTELYLSGNELTSLPSDDLEAVSALRVLHINGNKFMVLPAELAKVQRLAVLDVGSNSLKYNVSNWPYDWNWNWNPNLKYLNLSANRRLEIKPSPTNGRDLRDQQNFADFTSLQHLKVLGLMDVTLTIPPHAVPDQTEDRRIRTSGSTAGIMSYGMADFLGKDEHLSMIDMVVSNYRKSDEEFLIGLFDGQSMSTGGSKVAKYLHENFSDIFSEELSKLKPEENPGEALRRAFLTLNKDLITSAMQTLEEKANPRSQNGVLAQMIHRGSTVPQILSHDDLKSGGVATVVFIQGSQLYIGNVGDSQAMLLQSQQKHRMVTKKHDPAEPQERQRIRDAGGFVSRHGKLNDSLLVSRAFGYVQNLPCVNAAPNITNITLTDQDEILLIASAELWDYVDADLIKDVARTEGGDLMRAAAKLRDFAIAYGADRKMMIMMVAVGDLKKRDRARLGRTQSISMATLGFDDDLPKHRRKVRDGPDDSALARLPKEVEAPRDYLTLVFTDIKGSTALWESYPTPMRAAIKLHNQIMRRQLRILGGYEVKTEGDAFMVCFPTATSALLWCFTVQLILLEAPWPKEILESVQGEEILDEEGTVIYRGLSVRMGAHWGAPVCEPDPVTRRMDYFGPMVNRTARISAVADGGQINVSQDFMNEISRSMQTYEETDRSNSTASEDTMAEDRYAHNIRKELASLTSTGYQVKDLGERRLKGLENPESIYALIPSALSSRLLNIKLRESAEQPSGNNKEKAQLVKESQLASQIDTENAWELWNISLRLEMLCSTLENPNCHRDGLKQPVTGFVDRMKSKGGEITDHYLLSLMDHQISKIEACCTTLYLRHLARPFHPGMNLLDRAQPISDVLTEISSALAELSLMRDTQSLLRQANVEDN